VPEIFVPNIIKICLSVSELQSKMQGMLVGDAFLGHNVYMRICSGELSRTTITLIILFVNMYGDETIRRLFLFAPCMQ